MAKAKSVKPMTERKMERLLTALLERCRLVESTRTFSERGLMTINKGVVVCTRDGSEFQLTIVDSSCSQRNEPNEATGLPGSVVFFCAR
jgi:hypothetical protein